jgi:hypothetical protein
VNEHNMVGVLCLYLPYAIYLQQGQTVSFSSRKRIRCSENPAQASLPAEGSENGSFHQWLVLEAPEAVELAGSGYEVHVKAAQQGQWATEVD